MLPSKPPFFDFLVLSLYRAVDEDDDEDRPSNRYAMADEVFGKDSSREEATLVGRKAETSQTVAINALRKRNESTLMAMGQRSSYSDAADEGKVANQWNTPSCNVENVSKVVAVVDSKM